MTTAHASRSARGASMRSLLITAGACLLVGCAPDPAPSPPGPPNIIVFTVDTLRADRVGWMGHPEANTPQLDRFAAGARIFEQATTPLTRTTPALASLLTGLDPRGHGSWEVGAPIHKDVSLLAEQLSAAGWATIAVSGSRVASPKQGLGRGFDTFLVEDDPRAAQLVQTALSAVSDIEAARPVFLWVHTTDPHFPYAVPDDHPAAGTTRRCDALGKRFRRRPKARWRIFSNHDGAASAALSECQRAYDAEVHAVDTAFGTLLEGLGPRGDDIVVVTSDHGENQGEGGLWYEHGPDAHDATLRIPLLMTGPGLASGRDPHPARLQDIAPTLQAMLDLPASGHPHRGVDLRGTDRPEAAAGLSASALHVGLTHYLRSGRGHKRHCLHAPATPTEAISLCSDGIFDRASDPTLQRPTTLTPERHAELEAASARWPPEQTRQWVVRTPEWKLIATPRLEGDFSYRMVPTGDEDAPDHSTEHPGVREKLEAILMAESRDAGVIAPGTATRSPAQPPSTEDEEALRTLGYIE